MSVKKHLLANIIQKDMKIVATMNIKIKRKKKSIAFSCDLNVSTKSQLLRHYEVSHEVNISKKTINFNSTEELNFLSNNLLRSGTNKKLFTSRYEENGGKIKWK